MEPMIPVARIDTFAESIEMRDKTDRIELEFRFLSQVLVLRLNSRQAEHLMQFLAARMEKAR